MRSLIAPTLAISTLLTCATAHAAPPAHRGSDVVCFLDVTGPAKISPLVPSSAISYGYRVHCNGTPKLRSLDIKLWRHDRVRNKDYIHDEWVDHRTDPEVDETLYAHCSTAGIIYDFHVQAELWALNGNWDSTGANSEPAVPLPC